MGKRKAAAKKPTGPRKSEPLPTVFPCLFCNHEKSVVVKLDKKAGVGYLNCKICNQQFQCAVNYLSSAVDVYADWVDACDAVAKLDGEEEEQARAVTRTLPGNAATPRVTSKRQIDHQGNSHEKRANETRFASSSGYTPRLSMKVDDDDY